MTSSAKAVFLDRDGVINESAFNTETREYEAPKHVEDLKLRDGVPTALHRLKDKEYLLIVVSNQPDYAKGKTTMESLQAVHAALVATLDEAGVTFHDVYYAYHHPDAVVPELRKGGEGRKPDPLFLFEAAAKHGIDVEQSWFVGDRMVDMQCGRNAGCKTILVEGWEPVEANAPEVDFTARDLPAAVEIITGESKG